MSRIHFIGIGGTGLSAIATLLLDQGHIVSGSDLNPSRYFEAVTGHGAITALGHHPELAVLADKVVRSSAIPDSDPEVVAAKTAGISVLKRAEILAELTAGKETLAVAGSHGKTTTTAMLVTLLSSLGQEPTYVLGAEIKALGTNAHSGKGPYFVIEADEYDYMFLGLSPRISVITNIEHDHPDFFPTPQSYLEAFYKFFQRTTPNGLVIACADDEGVRQLVKRLPQNEKPLLTYGFSEGATYRISGARWEENEYRFSISYEVGQYARLNLGYFSLTLPGKHNILNATAAIAVTHQLGLPVEEGKQALHDFTGTERRFDVVYQKAGVSIMNDYGHHPTQIRATLSAARERFPETTLWAIWEPHTFSRTETLQEQFITALDQADRVAITRIFAAREKDDGFTPQVIANSLSHNKGVYLADFATLADYVAQNIHHNDTVVVFSAGKGPQLSAELVRRMEEKNAREVQK